MCIARHLVERSFTIGLPLRVVDYIAHLNAAMLPDEAEWHFAGVEQPYQERPRHPEQLASLLRRELLLLRN
jgi:hypothetical protein